MSPCVLTLSLRLHFLWPMVEWCCNLHHGLPLRSIVIGWMLHPLRCQIVGVADWRCLYGRQHRLNSCDGCNGYSQYCLVDAHRTAEYIIETHVNQGEKNIFFIFQMDANDANDGCQWWTDHEIRTCWNFDVITMLFVVRVGCWGHRCSWLILKMAAVLQMTQELNYHMSALPR